MKKRPLIMPYQDEPFNGDVFVQQQFLYYAKKFGIKRVIETGTCLGSTTNFFAENFEYVDTIEINNEFLNLAKEWCIKHKNINFILGNSAVELVSLLQKDTEPIAFFLDAHFNDYCPLQDELMAISQFRSGQDVICIHDFVVPERPEFGFDSWNNQPFTFEWLKPIFDLIYKNGYKYHYNNEVYEQSAKRGIIILEPKL